MTKFEKKVIKEHFKHLSNNERVRILTAPKNNRLIKRMIFKEINNLSKN